MTEKFIFQPHNYQQMKTAIAYLCDIHQISEDTLLKIFKDSFYRFDMMVICSLGSHLITIESCDDYIDPQDFIKDFCQPWYEHLEKIVFTRKSKATREGKSWT